MNRRDDTPNLRPVLRVWVSALSAGQCVLGEESSHYLTRVHRLTVGQRFIGFDPEQGTRTEGTIVGIERGRVQCLFSEPVIAPSARRHRITLIQGIGKGDKPDRVVRAATELGAAAVHWARCERSVVAMGERATARLERWKAIAIDAARQSGRPDLPELRYRDDLNAALAGVQRIPLKLLLSPDAAVALPSLLSEPQAQGGEVALLVGPEGGFSPQEEAQALAQGFLGCRLSDYVLRTETAAIAALGALVSFLSAGEA